VYSHGTIQPVAAASTGTIATHRSLAMLGSYRSPAASRRARALLAAIRCRRRSSRLLHRSRFAFGMERDEGRCKSEGRRAERPPVQFSATPANRPRRPVSRPRLPRSAAMRAATTTNPQLSTTASRCRFASRGRRCLPGRPVHQPPRRLCSDPRHRRSTTATPSTSDSRRRQSLPHTDPLSLPLAFLLIVVGHVHAHAGGAG
jgi:hypothetical protein